MKPILQTAIAALGVVLAVGPSIAKTPAPVEPRVVIRAADLGGIREWQSRREDGRDVLYIQDRTRNWYRATFFGACNDLGFTDAVGFITDATGALDRFSAIAVRHDICRFQTLTRVDGLPKKGRTPPATS